MFIRRKPNKSGSFSIQVINKIDGRSVLVLSFGSSKDEMRLRELEEEASGFINHYEAKIAYKFYKELERIIATLGIGLSVDKVLDIAKTIVTITVKDDNGNVQARPLLLTDEQRLIAPLMSQS